MQNLRSLRKENNLTIRDMATILQIDKSSISLYENGKRSPSDAGKIAMWAWAAMRVMDYVMTLPEIDRDNIAVIGHSRLGKTALLCAKSAQARNSSVHSAISLSVISSFSAE